MTAIVKYFLTPQKLGRMLMLLLAAFFFAVYPADSSAGRLKNAGKQLDSLIAQNDAALLTDAQGNILYQKNATKALVPASVLKIFTALTALYYLKPDYHFVTDFYQDSQGNLKVKGHGDPSFTSEDLLEISETMKGRFRHFNDLILDAAYFQTPIVIPGRTLSNNPYDAPNGALCVNFNTVFFKQRNGVTVSSETQTPLLPIALKRIRQSGLKAGRITFSHDHNEITLYTGLMLRFFLSKKNIKIKGAVKIGRIDPERDTLILRRRSKFKLTQVISRLLEYSNNFTANQLLIACGAKAYGAPGDLTKGLKAARVFARDVLKLKNLQIAEGSGISRKNHVTAMTMLKILNAFEPYRNLMRHRGREFYKTGSLTGVKTRAGYLKADNGQLYRFVVMLNTPGKSAGAAIKKFKNGWL
ncbi:D-alanyl-D-alanine carboxypeptidase [Desulfococcaceae bacterium HSG9]|nr:D-alanyl-D-alanine carboxypeptidase [Desulfococcaceae bacterium HSG9]